MKQSPTTAQQPAHSDSSSNKKLGAFCSILLVFVAFFVIEMVTPFHSDDYHFSLLDVSWKEIATFYMGWSGRVLANWAGILLLACKNQIVISLLIAFFATGMLYLVSRLPGRLFNTEFSPYKFLILFALYWICNPNLGQVAFWVVGACNYLITNFFIVVFLTLFFLFRSSTSSAVRLLLFISAAIAGCTNENTSVTLLCTFTGLCLVMKFFHIPFNAKTAIIAGAGLLAGTLILILAPGNYVRMEKFAGFKEKALTEKIIIHLRRINLHNFGQFLPVCALGITGSLFLWHDRQHEQGQNIQRIVLSILFFLAGCAAFAIMVASPYMPPRSFSGTQFFLLIALSFVLDGTDFKGWPGKLVHVACLSCFLIFAYSFSLVCTSYVITKDQEKLRNDLIMYEKEQQGATATAIIPDWYFVHLFRPADMFDLYHSPAMPRYYGVAKIDVMRNMDYDYSVLLTGTRKDVVKQSTKSGEPLVSPCIFMRTALPVLIPNGTIALETATDIRGKKLVIVWNEGKDMKRRETVLSGKVFKFKDKYCTGVTIPGLKEVSNVELIEK